MRKRELRGRNGAHPQMPESLRVLFIEDDPAIAEMYALKLDLDGYAVSVAADGESGLEMARQGQPQAIFLDIRLPQMDGFAVLEALRSDPATQTIPILMLSNYSDPDYIGRAMNLGAAAYLIKTETSPADLSKRLAELGAPAPLQPQGMETAPAPAL
ncbi:MAG: response regulator [Chloroflexi bacterium]|nr:MAG: response regulator [Chloroflexota bacterium]